MSEATPGGAAGPDQPSADGAQGRQRKHLWPIGVALTTASLTAVASLIVLMTITLAVLGFPHIQHSKDLPFNQLLDVLKLVFGTVAGAGALFALVMTYRRQRLAEAAHDHTQRMDTIQQTHQERIARNAEHDAAERRITELYNAAAEQLASSKAPVRLTALYTLERLANDNPLHRQTIVNILCAYLRMPFEAPSEVFDYHPGKRNAARRYRAARAGLSRTATPASSNAQNREELEVRLTAQRILEAHLVRDKAEFWGSLSLDLTSATLVNFSLARCHIAASSFKQATFIGVTRLFETIFDGTVEFHDASFEHNAFFDESSFTDTYFVAAHFERDASFDNFKVEGEASFTAAAFRGEASFSKASFNGRIDFWHAHFYGPVNFTDVTVTDANKAREFPSPWKVEPTEGGAGRLVAGPTPLST